MEQPILSRGRVSDARPVLPGGFKAAALHCGIRAKKNKLDLGLIVASQAFPAAALFTKNLLLGAHVVVGRESLKKSGGKVRALLVNSGNANCSTGEQGLEDNRRVQAALAEIVGCPPEQVLFMSTGVIGARLPVERILDALPNLHGHASERGLGDFATAIMTTDLVPKVRTVAVEDRSGPPFRVTGVSKGSGMIHPNMATMFGFLLTDGPPIKDVKSVRLPELTEEFLTQFGVKTSDQLDELIKVALDKRLEYRQRQAARQQVTQHIAATATWELPQDLLVRQARDQGFNAQMVSEDAMVDNQLWAIAGDAAEGLLMTFAPDPRNLPTAKSIVEKFKAAGYDPEGYTLYTYAAFEVFKQAAEKAGSTDAEKLAAAIHGQSYDTVLGKLTFDDKGDIVNPEYVFYVWSKGQYKEVGS